MNFCGENFNPRYALYAKARNHAPEEQLEVDRDQYPGGKMAGFTIWIVGKWDEWTRECFKNPPAPGWTPIEWQRYLASWNEGSLEYW